MGEVIQMFRTPREPVRQAVRRGRLPRCVTPIGRRQAAKAEPITQPEAQPVSWADFSYWCYQHGLPPEQHVEFAQFYNQWTSLPEETRDRMRRLASALSKT
jgi:hypothetical protein